MGLGFKVEVFPRIRDYLALQAIGLYKVATPSPEPRTLPNPKAP